MRFPAGSTVTDAVGMGFGRCMCIQKTDITREWTVMASCEVHCTTSTYVPRNDDSASKPVQMTVGAKYYEKAMLGHVPGFMNHQCSCENVGYNKERDSDIFMVMSGCRMHDPASNYQGNNFPVAKTVMK